MTGIEERMRLLDRACAVTVAGRSEFIAQLLACPIVDEAGNVVDTVALIDRDTAIRLLLAGRHEATP